MINIDEFLVMIESANRWSHNINYRSSPLKYEVTNDCGGMYVCDPYKSRLMKVWRFMSVDSARQSARDILSIFYEYVAEGDFVGADLARKYLQAGSSRDTITSDSRLFFTQSYKEVKINEKYLSLKVDFLRKQKQKQEQEQEQEQK